MDTTEDLWDVACRGELKAQIAKSKYGSMRALAADPSAGMAYTTLRRYITGEREITAKDLGRLLTLMDVQRDFFWAEVGREVKRRAEGH